MWTTKSRSSAARTLRSARDSRRMSAGLRIWSRSFAAIRARRRGAPGRPLALQAAANEEKGAARPSAVARDDAVGELAQLLGVGDAAAVEGGVGGAAQRLG